MSGWCYFFPKGFGRRYGTSIHLVNAAFTTLLASCRMVGVEPWEYLRDLFCLLPAWPAHRVLELAPAYWAGTREREDVVAMLAADPYRAATL